MTNYRNYYKAFTKLVLGCTVLFTTAGCSKLIDNNPSGTQLLYTEVFKDSATVKSAVAGVYSYFSYGDVNTINMSRLPGFSADELQFVGTTFDQFINNALLSEDAYVANLWTAPYKVIYYANSIMEGMQISSNLTPAFQAQSLAEARFLRAFSYFNLVNLFGDVPLVVTTNVDDNKLSPRVAVADIYNLIIQDLLFAQANLPADYSIAGGVRTRANKWAATALLARAYLYTGKWSDAEAQATAVLNNQSLYALPTDLTKVFTSDSKEAIFQIYNVNNNGYTNYAANMLPDAVQLQPKCVLTDQLKAAFETGDTRKTSWTGTVTYAGVTYTYPAKYKSLATTNAEYYTPLRLAEQYLVRAEARAQQNKLSDAKDDVNTIRGRAGLGATPANDKDALLLAIEQERRIEFNCENAHRWFDLKRTGRANTVLGAVKTGWTTDAALYPVPNQQRINNANLTQNNGYH